MFLYFPDLVNCLVPSSQDTPSNVCGRKKSREDSRREELIPFSALAVKLGYIQAMEYYSVRKRKKLSSRK